MRAGPGFPIHQRKKRLFPFLWLHHRFTQNSGLLMGSGAQELGQHSGTHSEVRRWPLASRRMTLVTCVPQCSRGVRPTLGLTSPPPFPRFSPERPLPITMHLGPQWALFPGTWAVPLPQPHGFKSSFSAPPLQTKASSHLHLDLRGVSTRHVRIGVPGLPLDSGLSGGLQT